MRAIDTIYDTDADSHFSLQVVYTSGPLLWQRITGGKRAAKVPNATAATSIFGSGVCFVM